MKQRIRGLVSLHEIPFSSRALQREEGNCPHCTKRGREGGMRGERGRKMERGRVQKPHRIRCCFSCFRRAALLCMAAAPPVTSHISIQETVFVLLFFFLPVWQRGREREREGGREGGRKK